MLNFQVSYFFFFLNFFNLYILLLAILVYLFLLSILFLLFFFFNISKINNLFDVKFFNSYNFFSFTILIIFLSLAGIPPFLGFISKFLLFIVIFNKNYYLFLFYFTILNIFMIYFYTQNTRFLIKKINTLGLKISVFYNSYLYSQFNLLVFFNFFNIFSFLLIDN